MNTYGIVVRLPAILLAAWLAFAPPAAQAGGRTHPERWYQDAWCSGRGVTEAVLDDGSRCDCLTPTHAVEFDFGRKWAEAVGQALNYGSRTGLKPGIVLILERPEDIRYARRVEGLIRTYGLPVDLWLLDGQGRAIAP